MPTVTDKLEKQIKILSEQIENLRIKSNLSQVELAELLDTSQSAISKLEHNDRLPNLKTLYKLAKATNTELVITFESKKKSKTKRKSKCQS